MKHIKPYQIFESQEPQQHPVFPKTEDEIHEMCKKYKIANYTINDDLTIDVNGNVDLRDFGLKYLPLNFNYVSGSFVCYNNELVTLKGSPSKVGHSFVCSNNKLKILDYCPTYVKGYFFCQNNELETLEGSPKKVGDDFECYNNKLMSLKYIPSGIDYNLCPIIFDNNPIYTLIYTFIKSDNVEDLVREFNDYDIVRGNTVVLNRLKTFISDFNLEMPDLDEVKKYYKINI